MTTDAPTLNSNCRDQYQRVLDARRANFDEYFGNSEFATQHQLAHCRLLDIENVFSSVSGRREYRLYEMAHQLLADGLCQVACANYRLAFYCLRAFLEQSVAGIRFSAFEYELREWEAGRRDVSWSVLCSDENGCFSANFVNAFLPDIRDEAKHYLVLAKRAYRECSEYVHGNPNSHGISHKLEMGRIASWFELYSAVSTSVLFGFFVRYLQDLVQVGKVSEEVTMIAESELGHFSSVRRILGYGVTNG